MSFDKEIQELLEQGIITSDDVKRIRDYRASKVDPSGNRLFMIFGILGAILVGLGVILIVAHNWDDLSRGTKTVFAFLPLVVGQGFCLYALAKKSDNSAWKESSATFLFFAIGTSISLVSQIYNIPGNFSSFMVAWMLLALPLIYLMRSSMVSLLYIVGITTYAVEHCYSGSMSSPSIMYWVLLILGLPHYYLLLKNRSGSNFTSFHNWFYPLSLLICFGILGDKDGWFLVPGYMSLLGLMYLVGSLPLFKSQHLMRSGFRILGSLGMIGLLLFFTFSFVWEELLREKIEWSSAIYSPEMLGMVMVTVASGALLFLENKNGMQKPWDPFKWVFLIFLILFFIGFSSSVPRLLTNILVLALGLMVIRNGSVKDHLGIVNFGLLIITALVLCRFFDDQLSFILRGILFLAVGVGFFVTNYMMLKKRRSHD